MFLLFKFLFRSAFLFFTLFMGVSYITLLAQNSDTSRTEWIKINFNMSGGEPGQPWQGDKRLMNFLIDLIDNATASIDLCIYDLEHPAIGKALAKASKRGLRVRVVTDNYNRTDSKSLDPVMWELFREANIISIDDDGDIYYPDGRIEDNDLVNDGADMHNKFAIIDALTPDPDDDYVWTGSTNLTYTGGFNTNNTIVIKDSGVAQTYLMEFEQMWGSSGDKPNASKSAFHKDKKPIPPGLHWVGDIKVEIHFSPIDRNNSKPLMGDYISDLIRKETDHDISFSAFAFTPSFSIAKTIWDITSDGSILLKGVIDGAFYSRYKKQNAIWASPEAQLGNRSVFAANEMRKLHHKTIVIDAENPDPNDQAIVITGSYNFSRNADVNNDENSVIIYSDSIAALYHKEFMGIYGRAKREIPQPVPNIATETPYRVYKVRDGQVIEIEIVPGFGYPIYLLGINAPRYYWEPDSTQFYSIESKTYLQNVLKGKDVRLFAPGDKFPVSYGKVYAYINAESDKETIAVNHLMIREGYAQFSDYFRQHPDSVRLYKKAEKKAADQKSGMWKSPDEIGTIKLRKDAKSEIMDAFPININSADEFELTLLPGIGPSKAKAIIDYRDTVGLFGSVDELTQIKGIGLKTLQKLRPFLTITSDVEE